MWPACPTRVLAARGETMRIDLCSRLRMSTGSQRPQKLQSTQPATVCLFRGTSHWSLKFEIPEEVFIRILISILGIINLDSPQTRRYAIPAFQPLNFLSLINLQNPVHESILNSKSTTPFGPLLKLKLCMSI